MLHCDRQHKLLYFDKLLITTHSACVASVLRQKLQQGKNLRVFIMFIEKWFDERFATRNR